VLRTCLALSLSWQETEHQKHPFAAFKTATLSDDSLSQPNRPSHKWKEISNLPEDLMALRDRELESLKEVWTEQRGAIGDKAKQFMDELKREWSLPLCRSAARASRCQARSAGAGQNGELGHFPYSA